MTVDELDGIGKLEGAVGRAQIVASHIKATPEPSWVELD